MHEKYAFYDRIYWIDEEIILASKDPYSYFGRRKLFFLF